MEPWLNISIFGITQLFMLVGLFGLLVPAFPGMLIMWGAALFYGIATGFDPLGIFLFVVITLLALGGSLVDNVLMGAGARKAGAPWLTIGIAWVAGIVGTLALPPLGGVIAAPLSVLLLEHRRLGDWKAAWQSVRGLAIGFGLSFVARFLIGLLMMGLWWVWAWQA